MHSAFAPAFDATGRYIGKILEAAFNEKDASNVRAHVENVKEQTGISSEETPPSKMQSKIFEWAHGASSIDPNRSPVSSAAWEAALDEILTENDGQHAGYREGTQT